MNPWTSWSAHFNGCPPVGYLLREAVGERWLRVYNLPHGKRLPRSREQFAVVRERQNAVAAFVLGHRAKVIVWITSYKGAPRGAEWRGAPPRSDWSAGVSDALGEPDPEFYYKQLTWVPGSLSEEFAEAARGECGPMAVFSLGAAEVFCPYDGGMDLFLADASRVTLVRTRFSDWLSPLPSGL